MDAREQLRRYLEQRRELGEQELVLDSLTVDEAMRILGAGASAGASAGAPTTSRGTAADVGPSREAAPTAPDATPPRRGAPDIAAPAREAGRAPERGGELSSDWREALRATGAAPATDPVAVEGKGPGGKQPPIARVAGEPSGVEEAHRERVPTSADPSAGAGSGTAGGTSALAPDGLSVGGDRGEPFDGPLGAAARLDDIAKLVAGCTKCPLYATALNPVPGSGNPAADFMCIGEAPGQTEDEQGLPFVGAAGQLLTKIIGAIDLKREDVFIANVLKHRPPGNRNPLPNEVAACSPYLIRQIELVRPKVILALGTFAAQTLLQTKLSIGKLRGQIHRYHGVPLIVTYHPAALLRNPSWKRPTWEDVQLARRVLDRAAERA